MNEDTVIEIENISKAYSLYKKPLDLIKELIFGGVRHDLFWALRNLSLKVQSGQRVGIVGPNGAGKSTLLKIIAGNLQPSSGSVKVNGSISALLSMVPAWNLEQTGIENIRFNLLLYGCSPSQIEKLTEDIIDFAEIGPFINHPVKTYSTGMGARLSFAIATAISPEILIVDEVLSVGDGYFAGKAIKRMKEMCSRGKALLFVSHSTAAVRQMCDTAIWMESGGIRLMGPVDYVTAKYDEDMAHSDDQSVRPANIQRVERNVHVTSPDDITAPDTVRLRLRVSDSSNLASIYYIRDIQVNWRNGSKKETISIPLEVTDDQNETYLDAMGCEWGRIFTHHDTVVRGLASRTGVRKGGHIIIKRPSEFIKQDWPIEVEWTVMPEGQGSDLILEYIDLETAVWKPFKVTSKQELSDGWSRFTASGALLPIDDDTKEKAVIIASERRISPIEIADVIIVTKSGRSNSIREREPFSIQVHLDCLKDAPPFNVSLIIYRSDGVYAFWQPSDFDGQLSTTGATEVCLNFNFDDNYFSSGEYDVTVNAMTPWHKDVEQSEIEVFDRKTGVTRFTIKREFNNLQFGAINYRARVEIK